MEKIIKLQVYFKNNKNTVHQTIKRKGQIIQCETLIQLTLLLERSQVGLFSLLAVTFESSVSALRSAA